MILELGVAQQRRSGFGLLREPPRTERLAKVGLGEEGGSLAKTLKSVLTVPSYLLLALTFVLGCTAYQLVLFWLPRHFWELFSIDLAGAGRMSTSRPAECGRWSNWSTAWPRCRTGVTSPVSPTATAMT